MSSSPRDRGAINYEDVLLWAQNRDKKPDQNTYTFWIILMASIAVVGVFWMIILFSSKDEEPKNHKDHHKDIGYESTDYSEYSTDEETDISEKEKPPPKVKRIVDSKEPKKHRGQIKSKSQGKSTRKDH